MTTSGLAARVALYGRSGPNRPQIHSFIMNRCNPGYRWILPQTHFGPQYGSLGDKIARKWHLNLIPSCGTHHLAAMGYFTRFHVLWCKWVFGSHLAKKSCMDRGWETFLVVETSWRPTWHFSMPPVWRTVWPLRSIFRVIHFPTRHTLCSDVFLQKKSCLDCGRNTFLVEKVPWKLFLRFSMPL